MRLALISDIHGNLPALEAVVADLAARGLTRVANLGDHVSGPLWPRETAELLIELGWTAIRGNHDRQVLEDPASLIPSDAYARAQLTPAQLEWLRALPSSTTMDEGRLRLVHGIPDDDRIYLLETPDAGRLRLASPGEIGQRLGAPCADPLACGHSHVPRVLTTRDGVLMVNPGSVGLQAYAAHTPEPHVSETGSPHARYAIVERAGTGWRVALVAVEYDWERASARAGANGRDDWALSLRTGYAPRLTEGDAGQG